MIDACLPPKETILGMSSEVISDRCRSCVKDVVQKVGDSWTEGGRRVGPGKGWELFLHDYGRKSTWMSQELRINGY